jgi:hypothetical protein
MRTYSQKDFLSGLMFMATGTAFFWGSGAYTLGTEAEMGPGYFPHMLGLLLALLGGAITFKSMVVKTADSEKIGGIAWRPLLFIILSNLVFGACIGGLPSVGLPPLGIILGIFMLTLIAAFAGEEFVLKEVLVLAFTLCVISYLAFIVLLKLQFPVWPAFIKF